MYVEIAAFHRTASEDCSTWEMFSSNSVMTCYISVEYLHHVLIFMWFIAFKCYKLNIFTRVQQMLIQQRAVSLPIVTWDPLSPIRGRIMRNMKTNCPS
jgi:hypothetical protein